MYQILDESGNTGVGDLGMGEWSYDYLIDGMTTDLGNC